MVYPFQPTGSCATLGAFNRAINDKKSTFYIAFPLVLACFVVPLLIDLYVYKNGYNWPPIRSDGFGHYLYLPAIFIHGDIFFNFLNDPAFAPSLRADYPFADWMWAGLREHPRGFVDKYPAGVAILQLPFFLPAWAVAKITSSAPLTGFELPFQVASSVSGAFYFAVGMYLLFRILVRRTTVAVVYLCLLFVLTATNVLLYASYDASFAHIYSFFLVSALCAIACASDTPARHSFAFGLLLGLAVVVRPTNIVAALLIGRLIWRSDRRQMATAIGLVMCGLALAASPQAAIWLKTSGSIIHYSYGGEGFRFLQPELLNYLFSFRKGAFFWHPAYFFMIVALAVHYRQYPREAMVFLAMIALNLYVGASWNTWWFGGSFGSRQTVDVLPVMAIATSSLVGYLTSARRPLLPWLSAALAITLATVNLVQMRGYMVGTIPFDETTWESYKRFWMRTVGLPEQQARVEGRSSGERASDPLPVPGARRGPDGPAASRSLTQGRACCCQS
jgi:hypothetical protein